MDEFDEFPADEGEPEGFDDAELDAGLGDEGPSSAFDDFEDDPDPDSTDLESFEFGDEADSGLEAEIEEAFGDDLGTGFDEHDFEDDPDPAAPDDAAYAATYEDALVDQADNPAVFPPELDVDVPEPVDGYPWVDLDTLGQTETEPWVNTTDASDYAAADLDDVASEALARFWEQPM